MNKNVLQFADNFATVGQTGDVGMLSVSVPLDLVDQLFSVAVTSQQKYIKSPGFSIGNVPLSYVKEHHREVIFEHLKQFLLNYRVIHFLKDECLLRKIPIAGSPRLVDIAFDITKEVTFHFECTRTAPILIQDWKYFSFKPPKRKNYKDLDRQVDYFMAEEAANVQKHVDAGIALRDWVLFSVTILDQQSKPLTSCFTQQFWFKIGDEEVESSLRDLFIGKKIGETFITSDQGLQEIFSTILQTDYLFLVEVVDTVPHAYFDFELFKKYFRLKTFKEVHKKLIEVFSFRNDISQRRATVEDTLRLLIHKHKISAPRHLVLRQKNKLLRAIRENPDYTVYKKQSDFEQRVDELAQKQASELVFVDQFAHSEDLVVSHLDIKGYLMLTQRNRMKDFLYFDIPESTDNGHEIPVPLEEMKQVCLLEKGINHAIYYLTKK